MAGDYPIRVIVHFYSATKTYANYAWLDFIVKVHAKGELTQPSLLVTSGKIDPVGLLTLHFNHPLAVPESAVFDQEDSDQVDYKIESWLELTVISSNYEVNDFEI